MVITPSNIKRVEVLDILGRMLVDQEIENEKLFTLDLKGLGDFLLIKVVDENEKVWMSRVFME